MSRISDLAGFTTALSTTQDLSVGVITATSFSGDGSGLTGVASTDNIQTATDAKFLANVNISGVTTATGGFVGDLTGDVTGNASGTAGGLSGTPNITVGSVSASSGTISGNLSIGGTLTYQDVTNMDVLGVGTFQQGIQVLANGLNVTGVSTFNDNIDLQDDDKILIGTDDDLEIYHDGSHSHIRETGTGDLRLRSSKIQLMNPNSEPYFIGTSDGAAELYYDNSKKLETDTGGVKITGVATATSFVGDLTGNVTGDVTGNADTATTLETTRSINGVNFNGSGDITVNPTSGAFSNGQGARTIQSGGSASGGSSGDIYYIY